MKILLTGASSYVGARLFYDLSKQYDVIGTYFGNKLSEKFIPLDVTKSDKIQAVLSAEKPDIIIHAASNANSRWCEAHPEEAVLLNQESTQFIVQSANKIHTKVILISSYAAFHPANVYAKTKIQSEKYAQGTKAGWTILRPSLIIGFSPNTTNDRPFNRILKNLDEKNPAEYDTSWKFQPTYVHHISQMIDSIIQKNLWNETIPVAVPELKSRFDIAHDILSPFGISVSPIDKRDKTPVVEDPLEKLKEFDLPQYSYQKMIDNIVKEIQNRKEFETM